ncbi:hypothetical protein A8924_0060 [Saccharopolyspora erythraea NRRL 2338]|uniref:Uncharacterized protein n=2 Tax=Saccharopolyspora erythraea TaxID=1836 RepID=A4FQB6_SACEN|nr:hypothetical protein [Saccharopolyspora erythraea]EQD86315.1 hypothetical protein N599_10190 [Saccharopolyspora erythraea D]PFG92841.1 hypothetical protein A8924_0060 [Saccharopolyspora erythraea NRRL 2338]QRK89752.1 hypothetical protein JQX30_35460 [Saccharopolyspora erythraea]CAM06241.1 hypothetical protein SACE_7080 [Saccharopolyspora erythraea NRRL 2338]
MSDVEVTELSEESYRDLTVLSFHAQEVDDAERARGLAPIYEEIRGTGSGAAAGDEGSELHAKLQALRGEWEDSDPTVCEVRVSREGVKVRRSGAWRVTWIEEAGEGHSKEISTLHREKDFAQVGQGPTEGTVAVDLHNHWVCDSASKDGDVVTVTFGPGETVKTVSFPRIEPQRRATLELRLDNPRWIEGSGGLSCGLSMLDDPKHLSDEEQAVLQRHQEKLTDLQKRADQGDRADKLKVAQARAQGPPLSIWVTRNATYTSKVPAAE